MQPAERVLGAAVLDVDERLADLHGQLGRRRRRDLAAVPLERAHRGDDGSGAAGEDLDDLARFDSVAPLEIGRASRRESVCQSVSISVVAVALKKKQTTLPNAKII